MDAHTYYCPKCKQTWVDPATYIRDPGCKYCDGPRVLAGLKDVADMSLVAGHTNPVSGVASMLGSILGSMRR